MDEAKIKAVVEKLITAADPQVGNISKMFKRKPPVKNGKTYEKIAELLKKR
jgi:hypothetical protein